MEVEPQSSAYLAVKAQKHMQQQKLKTTLSLISRTSHSQTAQNNIYSKTKGPKIKPLSGLRQFLSF
jgi:hypothetical protein